MAFNPNLVQIFYHLKKIQPTSCVLCHQRRNQAICKPCLNELISESSSRNCLICGRPNHTWVCKLCIFARRSFDETIAINPETSKLYPLVCDCENGRIENLPSFILAWQVTAQRKMHPVDLMIPFPESIKKSQKRGFWFALELAKKFQITYQIPFERSLIESFEEDNESYTFKIRSKNPNPLPLHNFRVAIILPYMKKDYPVEKLALFLKKLGARWVSVWVLIRDSKKEDY